MAKILHGSKSKRSAEQNPSVEPKKIPAKPNNNSAQRKKKQRLSMTFPTSAKPSKSNPNPKSYNFD